LQEKITNIFAKGSNIFLFIRENKKLKVKEIKTFKPYFYVDDHEGDYTSIFGEKARKIIVNHPAEVREKRDKYDKTWESDVLYCNRFLIDRVDKIEKTKLRKQYFDIEVLTPGKFTKPEDPIQPVYSITVYDNYFDKYVTFIWLERKKYNKFNFDDNWTILEFSCEEEMIEAFLKFESKYFPDLLMGWGIDHYDVPYLFNRYTEDVLKEISPIKIAGHDKYEYFIAGMSFLDNCEMYKKITTQVAGKKESYSLDYISNYELGKGKEHPHPEYSWWKNNELEKIARYNKVDVQLCVELDKKFAMSEHFDSVRRITKCRFKDVFYNSKVLDFFLLDFAKRKLNVVLPSKKKNVKRKFVGGHVKEPERGLWENVSNLDATNLYSSIILSANISPDTLCEDGKIKLETASFMDPDKKLGLFPQAIKYILDERNNIKNKMLQYPVDSLEYETYNYLQYSWKGLANSAFGNLGFLGSRLYSRKCAENVTLMGQKIIEFAMDGIRKRENKVLYCDTDGAYFSSNKNNIDDIIKEGEIVQNIINNGMGDFLKQFGIENHYINFKFEKIYKRILLQKKKRYAGLLIWKEGQECNIVEIKGFESRRSDSPQVIRDFQKLLLSRIIRGEEEIDDFVIDFMKNIKSLPKWKLGFPVGINRDIDEYKTNPIHIRAAKYSMKYHDLDLQYGDKIYYIFVKNPLGKMKTDVIAYTETSKNILDEYDLDFGKIIQRAIMKIKPIYDTLGKRIPIIGNNLFLKNKFW